MDVTELEAMRQTVLWSVFAVALVFGWVVRRSRFCTMGAISDVVNMGDWTRLRMWALALGLAVLGFQGMVWLGWLDPSRTIYTHGRVLWLSALLGGALFGLGMVLASGCGSKTLVRMGGGSLKAWVVFVVMGLSAFATMRGLTAVARVQSVDRVGMEMVPSSDLPGWLAAAQGWPQESVALGLGLVLGLALVVWACWSREFCASASHWLGGLGVGMAVVLTWWVTGRVGWVPEHPETLETVYLATVTGGAESLTFTAPMALTIDWVIFFSDASKLLTVSVVSVLGVVLGAFLDAVATRSFRWEGFVDTQDTALHLVGAVLMGVGGVTAMGCTIGQGLSGLSTLSVGSFLAVLGIVLGALLGLKVQIWLLERA